MTQKKYILSHDVGTGGNKAVICDLNGQVLYSNYQAYGISYPNPEWVEQDPDELWRAVACHNAPGDPGIGDRPARDPGGRRFRSDVEYPAGG